MSIALGTDARVAPSYLHHGTTLASWLFTTDHKRIALLYFGSITVFFFLGGAAAALIRWQLISPEGALVSPETYNRLFTLHGVVMVWLFLVPAVPVTLGNFVVPLMLGARDLAFPRLNLLSWYIFIAGGLLVVAGLFAGGLDTGWTFYTPLSTAFAKGHLVLVAGGVFVTGFSSIATGLNFIVSIHRLRAPGMTWYRLPLFLWSLYATSVILVLGTPVLAITLTLLVFERVFGVGVFDPTLGGDPLLFQHLFWFYSHPAVYIMILPGMGIASEVVTTFSQKGIFGYKFIAWASISIAVISFFVWGHHMFVAGTSMYAAIVFSLLSYLVAVPSAIKVFNWIGTLHKGFIRFDAPMLYVLGFIGLFTSGGLTGLFLAALAVDVHVHDTYFVVAHFHFIMVGGMVSAYFAGLHYWWPKITGRLYPEIWARIAAFVMFLGFNLTFLPQFVLGWLGMPRRYATYPPEFQVLHVLSSAGATILAASYLMPMVYLTWSLLRGPRAPANPWHATGLEWQTPSPPPFCNFEVTPVVTGPPYAYPPPEEVGSHA
ncbi:Cytochrome c oxidase subunit 1 [Rhodovastum atsumiense]|uniref:Cytochrome c oxidase subunit I n=1 Tax=Rhodovastum atsumiense TaxID=504468 RepID=A0A5M6IZI4_9PROT|nr:cbb3-type cytochrome c oxidase subunit I [Rhodovastum atsumiense]KAA5613247.1 cytochrome c oxidase subunit I [Rhodovastum atsumiense]CAH2600595.1 Cytochrome c oxidase subunit 1 [Rhodovastum atsumiense]